MYIRLFVMSKHNCRNRGAEAQLRRPQNPAYRIQEQVIDTEQRQTAHTNYENRTQEQVADMKQRQIACTTPENRAKEKVTDTARRQIACTNPGTEHRSKSLIKHKDKMHAQTQRTEHRSKLLILHKEDLQENNLVFWWMRHYNDGKECIKWQQILMFQVAHTYVISLVRYGM
jgi:hypothetical protein